MNIQCQCGNSHKAKLKGYNVPKDANIMKCNFCPDCENEAMDYYEEWYEDKNGENLGNAN